MKIIVDETICKGCGLCIYYCPKSVIRFSNRRNEKGYIVVETANLEDCTGCKLCEICCPDLALIVQKESEKIDEKNPIL